VHRKVYQRVATMLVVLIVTGISLVAAQESGNDFGWFRGRPVEQNDPPKTELVVARWRFNTNGAIGRMGWSHNYPDSDRNLNVFLKRTTQIQVEPESYRIVDLGSDDVFDYPFAYISEPGEMLLNDQELTNLREFISRGGFILVDDFDGTWQLEQFRSQLRRAFPRQQLVTMAMDHLLFHAHFDLDSLEGMAEHVPGGTIAYIAMYDEQGRATIVAGHNNDLANFWEWYDTPSMPLKPSTDAFRLGSNAVIYAMTH
jgi:Domain of unknown function (DUF4159)